MGSEYLESEYREAAPDEAAEAEARDWIEWSPDEALDPVDWNVILSAAKDLPYQPKGRGDPSLRSG